MKENKMKNRIKEKHTVESEKIVKEIGKRSDRRTQRIVIDEILHDDLYRILSSELKTDAKKSEMIDPTAWSDEEEYYLDFNNLSDLLPKIKNNEINEGQVFRIEKKATTSISDQVKEQVGKKVKTLLDHEGKTMKEIEEGE